MKIVLFALGFMFVLAVLGFVASGTWAAFLELLRNRRELGLTETEQAYQRP